MFQAKESISDGASVQAERLSHCTQYRVRRLRHNAMLPEAPELMRFQFGRVHFWLANASSNGAFARWFRAASSTRLRPNRVASPPRGGQAFNRSVRRFCVL